MPTRKNHQEDCGLAFQHYIHFRKTNKPDVLQIYRARVFSFLSTRLSTFANTDILYYLSDRFAQNQMHLQLTRCYAHTIFGFPDIWKLMLSSFRTHETHIFFFVFHFYCYFYWHTLFWSRYKSLESDPTQFTFHTFVRHF